MGLFGPNDELRMLNLLMPEIAAAVASEIQKGISGLAFRQTFLSCFRASEVFTLDDLQQQSCHKSAAK
jgi:hypothetical protein